MTTNPFYNAVLAAGYITLVATIMQNAERFLGDTEDTVLAPIAFLSLFVLSAAMMGFIFFYQPVQMYLDEKKKVAVDLFLKTVGIFACITVALLFVLVFSSYSY